MWKKEPKLKNISIMKKNFLTIMFALLTVVTGAWAKSYGLYIGGTQVTDNNMNSLSSIEGVERGTITFNGSTLTLTDVLIDMAGFSVNGITIGQTGITLKLVGTNRIISDYAALCVGATTTINGPGKLEAYSKQNGILARPQSSSVTTGSLTIQNNACIDATGASRGIYDESKIFNVYIKGEETVVEAEGKLGESFYNFKSITLYNGLKVIMPNSAKIKDGSVVDGDAENIVVKYERVRIAFPEGLPINEANFPDKIFRKYVSNKLDSDGNGYLTDEEIAAVTQINVSVDYSDLDAYGRTKEYLDITTLQGIEYFTALKTLKCSYCTLPSLDLSNNLALTYLDCAMNRNLTSLDISKNTALEHLEYSFCSLPSLDVSIFPALTYLSCMDNGLTSLDVSNNLALTNLYCNGNSLNTLYVWNNTELTSLDCSNCNLSSIDLSNNRKLTNLCCETNPMSSIDVSNNTMLTEFNCVNCQLTSLDVSQNTALNRLWCDGNQLTSLDVSNNTALEILRCDRNRLTSLNVNNTSLNYLRCSQNRLKGVEMDEVIAALPGTGGDFYAIAPNDGNEQNVVTVKQVAAAKQKHWTTYYMYSDYDWREYAGLTPPAGLAIDEINFPDAIFRKYVGNNYDNGDGVLTDAEIAAVTEMNVSFQGIADLTGIEHFTELINLNCSGNPLTSLDLSNNLKLVTLLCYNCELSSLDLSKNINLCYLYCMANHFSSLDVSKNGMLVTLDCTGNELTSINLSQNYELVNLACSMNQLTSLDLSSCQELRLLNCDMNQIKGPSMARLISSLPWRDTSAPCEFHAIRLNDSYEQNVVTTTQVSLANDKGWVTYGYVVGTGWELYPGSVPDGIAIDEVNFPDPIFRAYVKANCQSDGDDLLTEDEILAVTDIDVPYRNIADLTGVEYFTELINLKCYGNSLTSLDVSKNTKLDLLQCFYCGLTSLDVSNNHDVRYLDCSGNQLTSLDVSQNYSLVYLFCSGNQLTSLDVSHSSLLRELSCFMNQIKGPSMARLISSLPWRDEYEPSEYGKLYAIRLNDSNEQNVVTTTLVSLAKDKGWETYGLTETGWELYQGSVPLVIAIDDYNFPDNNFRYYVKNYCQGDGDDYLTDEEIAWVTEINAGQMNILNLKGIELFTELKELDCFDNLISSLDLSKNTKLERLECSYNDLTSLYLPNNTALRYLFCNNNLLTSLNVTNNKQLHYLYCSGNQLNAAAMGRLVESMPTREEDDPGYFQVYDFTVDEHNVITTAQVQEARLKYWRVQAWTNNGTEEYEGVSVATGISTVNRHADGGSPFYSLDGQRINGQPTKSGIYVRNGRKVVVK